MLFNSQAFMLVFLPVTLFIFFVLWRKTTADTALFALIMASLFFYGWWNPVYVPLLAGSVLVNFFFGRLLAASTTGSGRRSAIVTLGVGFNLGLLGYFKYTGFLLGNLGSLTGSAFTLTAITLPLAISFYTFQQISYLVDVFRKKGQAYNLLQYAAYVTFFPQLIAGPIVRHYELIPQFRLNPLRDGVWERCGRGGVLFLIGLGKKVFFADQLAKIVDPVFAEAAAQGVLAFTDAWLAMFAFTWQIYFDFSGYSDMALGLALLFGYKLPVNFNSPYRATSIREIWQRWHITLSRFLRDYLFVPLARSRFLIKPRVMALVITMFLGGLWHGAAWTYVVWGLLHGVGLAVNTAFNRTKFSLPDGVGWVLTLAFWVETLVIFRSDSFATVAVFWSAMHDLKPLLTSIDQGDLILVVIAGLVALVGPASHTFALERLKPSRPAAVVAGIVLAIAILAVGGVDEQEFIYFQF